MAKIKVKNGTRTVWMVETRQVDYELEDGRVLGIRVKEDDNGSETFYCWGDEDGVIHRRGNWIEADHYQHCLLYTSPSPRDLSTSRMPSSA